MPKDVTKPGEMDTMFIKNIPVLTKARYKAWCALWGFDMRAETIDHWKNVIQSPPEASKIKRLQGKKITGLTEENNDQKA